MAKGWVVRIAMVAAAVAMVAGFLGAQNGAAAAGQPATGALRICTDCAEHGLDEGGRYHYVILQSWQSDRIPALRRQNPGIVVLAYENMSATVSYACTDGVDRVPNPSGVGWCDADAAHPDWFLTDARGRRVEFCDYPGLWLMDTGNPAYQAAWLDGAARVKSLGFDGVLIDDANQTAAGHLCGRTLSRYPDDAAYTAANDSFLAAVAPALRERGLLAFPNVALEDWWNDTGLALWNRWVGYASGGVQEYFSKWSHESRAWLTDDGGWHQDWTARQRFLAATQAAGKTFIGVTYAPSTDVRSMRYARASFLADWDGGPSALAFEPTDPEAQDPYAGAWTVDLGRPLGPRVKAGAAWRRDFERGTVVVNPSPGPVTVDLGGAFAADGLGTVTSVSVGSADAVFLTPASAPGGSTPDPAPAAQTGPVSTGSPALAAAGRRLRGSAGAWTGATGLAYAWERCSADLASCARVPRATGLRHTVSAADVGFRLRLVVTARNAAGQTEARSAAAEVTTDGRGRPVVSLP